MGTTYNRSHRIVEQIQEGLDERRSHAAAPEDHNVFLQDRRGEAQQILSIPNSVQNLPGGTLGEEAGEKDIGIYCKAAHLALTFPVPRGFRPLVFATSLPTSRGPTPARRRERPISPQTRSKVTW